MGPGPEPVSENRKSEKLRKRLQTIISSDLLFYILTPHKKVWINYDEWQRTTTLFEVVTLKIVIAHLYLLWTTFFDFAWLLFWHVLKKVADWRYKKKSWTRSNFVIDTKGLFSLSF